MNIFTDKELIKLTAEIYEKEVIKLITVKEDFEGVTEYQGLTDADKQKVWKYAQRKLINYLMQDYQSCLEVCVLDAINEIKKLISDKKNKNIEK